MYRWLIVLVCMLLAGCTAKLWNEEPERVVNVNGFYVNTETNDVVITTRREAYLFSGQQQLGQALLLSREVEFEPGFSYFTLTSSNAVTGSVALTLREEIPSDELIDQLTAIGFTLDEAGDHYQLMSSLKGERYIIEGDLPLQKLENEYPVHMKMPTTPLDTAGRVIATPVAIAFDAATIAVVIPLYALFAVSYGIHGP
ncbi:hypothetical protein [Vreelandella sp. GE22]